MILLLLCFCFSLPFFSFGNHQIVNWMWDTDKSFFLLGLRFLGIWFFSLVGGCWWSCPAWLMYHSFWSLYLENISSKILQYKLVDFIFNLTSNSKMPEYNLIALTYQGYIVFHLSLTGKASSWPICMTLVCQCKLLLGLILARVQLYYITSFLSVDVCALCGYNLWRRHFPQFLLI